MKKRLLSYLCVCLCGTMLMGGLAACKNPSQEDDPPTESEQTTDPGQDAPQEGVVVPAGNYGQMIADAYGKQNGVQTYYTSALRDEYVVENQNMTLKYQLSGAGGKMVSGLANKKGGIYLQNTMDAYVKTTDGGTYYLSESMTEGRANLFRLGYYYYDVRILDQNCISELEVLDEVSIDLEKYEYYTDLSRPKFRGGVMTTKLAGNLDPNVAYKVNYPTSYNYLEVTMKSEGLSVTRGDVYVIAGSSAELSEKQKVAFFIKNDGQYHTYRILLDTMQDYTGDIKTIRLDFSGEVGDKIEISSVKLLQASA